MAEGGKQQRSFMDSFGKASDDADKSVCDPCKSDGKLIAVEGYCQICDEYLRDTCLGVHRKQKITRAHAILDKKQMPTGHGYNSIQDICVDVCKTHHPEIIRFYCKAHDEPGCGDCMTLKHTFCKKDRVQDICYGFQKTKEFKVTDQKLQQLHQEIEEMTDILDNNLEDLDITYASIIRKITSVRNTINVYLDQIQKKITDEATEMKKKDERSLNILHAKNQAMKDEIEVMLKTIHDSKVNTNSLFVITKQAKQRLATMEKEINKMKQSQQQQYEFLISNEIQKIVFAKTPLGTLSRKPPQKARPMTEKRVQRTSRTSSIYGKATYNRNINVKGEIGDENCWITDCTLLGSDRLVVIDCGSKTVKLIDISNNEVISNFTASREPSKVTTLCINMIAVALPSEYKIQVFLVTSSFSCLNAIKVNNDCYGIAYKDGKFAVSYVNPGRVEILDDLGQVLHTIQPKQGTEYRFKEPYYITVGLYSDTIIVSDSRTHKVSVVTFKGHILRIYKRDTLKRPQGIVITADGVLFVCSFESGCIHVISPDFKTSKIILNNDDHVLRPGSITYCGIKHRLYIINDHSIEGNIDNYVQVYDLNV